MIDTGAIDGTQQNRRPHARRYVIFGAGGIGGVIGASLHLAHVPVALVARGEHLDAVIRYGLVLETASRTHRLSIPAVATPAELDLHNGDVIILATKSQDTLPALMLLQATVRQDVAIVCAQNGVENERTALRRFRDVYGMSVLMPATYLEPGVVQSTSSPVKGVLDVGRFPTGSDAISEQIAADMESAGFSSRAVPDIMRWKHGKLVSNIRSGLTAFCPPSDARDRLQELAVREAYECFAKAGIDFADDVEMAARRKGFVTRAPVPGRNAPQTSLWQSLQRGVGTAEMDYFSGEIALIGRLHGVACPVNAALQAVSAQMAHDRAEPGSGDASYILARAEQLANSHRADAV